MEYKIFGCKTNKYFTDRWAESPLLEGKQGVFISSCVVTDKAKSKWVRFAKQKLKTLKDGEKLYLSGCGSLKEGNIDKDFYTIYPELVDFRDKIELLPEDPPHPLAPSLFVGEGEQGRLPSPSKERGRGGGLLDEGGSDLKSRLQKAAILGTGLHTKKFIVIQTGCDNFCTFCLTVQARGRHKSRPSEDIIAEIRDFVASGGKEVVLTGTNLGAWGADSSENVDKSRFPELLAEILEKTTIERLRVSSLGVEFVDDRLLELFRKPRVSAYVHLSIQSGSENILRSMNRHYDRAKLLQVLGDLRSLKREDEVQINVGADLIVGFPGETDADFRDTLELVRAYGITQLHAFPFSAHHDHYSVPAGKFPNQVDEKIKTDRLNTLLNEGERIKQGFLRANDGKCFHVLVEGKGIGWTENYIECTPENFEPETGRTFEKRKIIPGVYRHVTVTG
ncbi:MAG: radical SAM protein [Candidatus Gracilibacteria bacterium]|nr:radical SAM protein [Candidatus Gracilibacteria bacterium]